MNETVLRAASRGLALCLAIFASPALSQSNAMQCPQPRFTGKAPAEYLARKNPLQDSAENLAAGKRLFAAEEGASCSFCHGETGAGNGALAGQFKPPPRNFLCAEAVNGIADGQLFWIIRFGSPGTAMPDHPQFSDEQIWQIVLHLRDLAK